MSYQLVDIKTREVIENVELSPLQFEYELNHCRVLYRDNEGWKIEPGTHKYHLSFGPLENPAKLYEIHGHMDRVPENCRKHSVNGKEYVGELHLLHYDTFRDYRPGLVPGLIANYKTIICILLEEVSNVNTELSKITNKLPALHVKNKKICLGDDIDPVKLFPKNRDFWSYEETVETPPGKVIWIVFKNPIGISEEQIKSLQSPYVETKTEEAACATAAPIQCQIERLILEGYAIPRISL